MSAELIIYQTISGIAIGIFLMDVKLKLKEEVDFLWVSHSQKPWYWQLNQFLYASCRFIPLLVWISNIVLSSIARKQHPHGIPLKGCRSRLIYETVVSYYLMGAIDLILLQRVYGLYKRSKIVRAVLVALFFIQIGQSGALIYVTFPRVRYTDTCVFSTVNPAMICSFLLLEIMLHAIFVILIILDKRRHERLSGPQTLERISPVLNAHVKHSCMVFTFMSGLVVASAFCGAKVGAASYGVFPLFVTGVSFLGCRLILELRDVQRIAREQEQPGLTVVEIAQLTQVSVDVFDSFFTRSLPPACIQPLS